jgi:hypothetical protein
MSKTFVCLTVLVTAARAAPSIRTTGGNVVIQGSDLRFTHDDASSVPISFTALASQMSSLESWKADAEQSIAAFAAFRAELATSCPTPGEVVVGVTPSGTLICTGAVNSVTSSVQTVMSQLREIGVNVSATAGSVALVRENLASVRANAAAGRAVNVAAIRVNAANLVELAANVTNNTIAINSACDGTVTKVAANEYSYIGQLPNGAGKQSTRGIASGNQKRYGTISCAHHCNDIFDGRTGRWGPDGNTYRASNGRGGGMEIRFDRAVKLDRWNIHCIRNAGSPTSDSGRGGVCYANGQYDFTRIEIDYWTSGGWVRAHTLNQRNQRNYMAGYTGSAVSQNWRIFFSGGGSTGRCQHPNGDCAPHVSEIELWIANC